MHPCRTAGAYPRKGAAMTDKQSKAVMYADKLEKVFGLVEYADEMRRLHEENKQLKDAVLAEREACAAKAEQIGQHKNHIGIAAAIRARGQQ